MKLKNKRTGEIPDKVETITYIQWSKTIMMVYVKNNGGRIVKYYDSLEAFNEEWEDVPEEPKEYWIPMSDEPYPFVGNDWEKEGLDTGLISLSKEENDKKRQKFKAWKRLKDKGFRFEGWYGGSRIIHFRIDSLDKEGDCLPHFIDDDTANDLDLLFCPEED